MNDFNSTLGIAFLKCNLFIAMVWIAWYATPVTSLRARVGLWRIAIVGALLLLVVASLATPVVRLPLLPNTDVTVVQFESKRLQSKPVSENLGELTANTEAKALPTDQQENENPGRNQNDVAIMPAVMSATPNRWAAAFWMPGSIEILCCIWLVGSMYCGFRLLSQWRYHARLLAKSTPVDSTKVDEWNERFTKALGRTRQVRPTKSKSLAVRWTKDLKTAAVTGVFRPVILLPESWQLNDEQRVEAALAHEMAHIQSRDIFWSTVIELFHAITWPSPLVWGIAAAHRRACERLADYNAWNAIGDRGNYRSLLASLAMEMIGNKSPLAVSMVRTPQILDRLQLLENLKANSRIGLGGKSLRYAILSLGLLVGSATLVPQRALLLANAATEETQETEKKSPPNSQTGEASNDESGASRITFRRSTIPPRETITVLNPDGTPANDAVYLITAKYTNFQLDEYASPEIQPKALPASGKLKLDMPEDQFLAVWNKNGFCEYTVSRLAKLGSLELQPWCKLTVHLRDGDRPLKGYRLSVRLTLTTDGMFQGIMFRNFGVTDDHGDFTFEKLPPGELEIAAEPVTADAANLVNKRNKYLVVKPGTSNELTIGDEGRGVTGRIALPDGLNRADIGQLEGVLINHSTSDLLNFAVSEDGIFTTSRIPTGQCTITIRTNFKERRNQLIGRKSIALSKVAKDLNGRQFVGTVGLFRDLSSSSIQSKLESKPIPITDTFTSQEKLAWFTTAKAENEEVYVLKNSAGKTIRKLDEAIAHVAFGKNNQNFAMDAVRNRAYLLANTVDPGTCSLLAIDMSGKQLYRIPLNPMRGYHLTLDSETGNLWLMVSEHLGRTELLVFDPTGSQLQKHTFDDGTAICYSKMDKVIWMAGAKKIVKIAPASGKVLASYDLPKGSWNCTTALPLPQGGVFSFEHNHPDLPLSKNRIWLINAAGNAQANLELEDFYVASVGLVQNELWISGFRLNQLWSRSSSTLDFRMICFDMELNQVKDVEYPYQLLHADPDGQTAWVRSGEEDLQVTYDADRKLKILARVPAVK